MTRRWSLIAVIVGLAVALTFVIVDMRSGTGAARETPEAAGPAGHGGTPGLTGVGWWPAHATSGRVAKDLVGDHHATLRGGASWTTGPKGGALLLDGSSGFADTGAAVLDTTDGDYSVAAWVRLNARGGFRTAVSLDGETASVFYLQYSDSDKRFSFSFVNARAVATTVDEPELGLWYHLVGRGPPAPLRIGSSASAHRKVVFPRPSSIDAVGENATPGPSTAAMRRRLCAIRAQRGLAWPRCAACTRVRGVSGLR